MVPAVAWSQLKLNSVLCFWAAYVVTRPLGASFADYFGKPKVLSGLDYGDGPVSFVLLLFIVVLVGYTALTRYDIQRPELAAALPDGGRRTNAGTPDRSPG